MNISVSDPVIHTRNFTLTLMKEEHSAQMFEFLADRETMKFLTAHPPKTVNEVRETITGYLEQYRLQKEIPWIVKEKNTDIIIGMFRLHKLSSWHKKTEMGVVIHKSFQQKGALTEIMPEVLSFCFNDLKLNRVVGDIFADNAGSRKLLIKYGFTEEGTLRQTDYDGERYHDTVVFSLLRSEYVDSVK